MSFSRWGQDSAVYIYEDSSYNEVVCLGCLLMPTEKAVEAFFSLPGEDDTEHETFHTKSLAVMLAHVREHREAGHPVPSDLEDKLRERWPYDGIE